MYPALTATSVTCVYEGVWRLRSLISNRPLACALTPGMQKWAERGLKLDVVHSSAPYENLVAEKPFLNCKGPFVCSNLVKWRSPCFVVLPQEFNIINTKWLSPWQRSMNRVSPLHCCSWRHKHTGSPVIGPYRVTLHSRYVANQIISVFSEPLRKNKKQSSQKMFPSLALRSNSDGV